jgi:adenylate cyclase
MAKEIERKFLVDGDFKKEAIGAESIVQGYLSSVPERSIRVRIRGDRAFINVKGAGNESGTTRFEWEKEITQGEARALMELCEPGKIEKVRYLVPAGRHVFEVDEFQGENAGLVLAEIELGSEDEAFERPSWLGEEVTGQAGYYNAVLIKRPYRNWDASKP